MGFDDNFTPAGTTQGKGPQNESFDAFPPPATAAGTSQPPPAASQTSPPTYDQSVPNQEPGDLPAEYNGLLPNRQDPTHAPDAPHSVESSTGAPVVGGEAQHKAPGPDFESAFSGMNLAPAKEAEDDDEDFEPPGQKNPAADFDFSFDSPSQQRTSSPNPNAASSDFFSFDPNVNASSSGQPAQPAAAPGGSTPKPNDHDWEALFAPLDNINPDPSGHEQSVSSDGKAPGWALQTDTGEDDQILQRLTGMGFPRNESLKALERFDYNIDKAVDFLTSKS